MNEYKDFFGREIQLGDICLTDRGSYRGLVMGIVIGFTPTMVRTNCGLENSENLLVADQLLIGAHVDEANKLREKWADKMNGTIKGLNKPPKYRYMIAKVKDQNDIPFVICMKVNCNTHGDKKKSVKSYVDQYGIQDVRAYMDILYDYPAGWRGSKGLQFRNMYFVDHNGMSLAAIKALGVESYIDRKVEMSEFSAKFPTVQV